MVRLVGGWSLATGAVTELIQLGNVVSTGLAIRLGTVWFAEVGAVINTPANGRVSSFRLDAATATANVVGSGRTMVIDVEFSADGVLYAVTQGGSPGAVDPGAPGLPDSARLLRVNSDGTFTVLVDTLDLPTSLDIDGDTAYLTTFNSTARSGRSRTAALPLPMTRRPARGAGSP